MEDFQFWFNIALGIAVSFGVWSIRNAVSVQVLELEAKIKNCEATIKSDYNDLKVEMVNEYLKQAEFRYHTERYEDVNTKRFSEIMDAIGKIYGKLDNKVDK